MPLSELDEELASHRLFADQARCREVFARLRAEASDPSWQPMLERRFVAMRRLPADDRAELFGHVRVLLAEKSFEGCGGLEMTDEVRVLIEREAAAGA